jgi:hypothetical protein
MADRVQLGRLNRACRKAVKLWGCHRPAPPAPSMRFSVPRPRSARFTAATSSPHSSWITVHQARLMFGPAVEEAIGRKLARLEELIAHPKNVAALRGLAKEARRGR